MPLTRGLCSTQQQITPTPRWDRHQGATRRKRRTSDTTLRGQEWGDTVPGPMQPQPLRLGCRDIGRQQVDHPYHKGWKIVSERRDSGNVATFRASVNHQWTDFESTNRPSHPQRFFENKFPQVVTLKCLPLVRIVSGTKTKGETQVLPQISLYVDVVYNRGGVKIQWSSLSHVHIVTWVVSSHGNRLRNVG